ncbi:hypothetical protein NQ315_006064 [Exocentrus adspersus]|uniref:Chromo domain-containing protein n=1 Tax=Exocentrus adspersus TaxID=1586481 RepID=A0AAV8VGU2_9CUCU|nr:hypothetical protein NQ315_006064 [Exocentrus adspersus]
MSSSSSKHATEKIQLVNELHKPARKNYPRRRTIIKGLDDLWQSDLAEMVGDIVRISKNEHVFAKGYTPNWTTELFEITTVKITNPITCLLEDMRGQPIQGAFYAEELQKTTNPDVYLVEKVLRRKGQKIYVKWFGLDKCHNS